MTIRVLIGYAVVFLAYFSPMPLRGELPGHVDTLFGIALGNLLEETFKLFVSGQSTTTIFFPEPTFLPYGENCFGLIALFVAFKKIAFGSDVVGYYLMTCALMTASAFGLSRLSSLFVSSRSIAIWSGFVFTLAGFTLANIDDVNVIFVFFPAMSLYFVEKGRRENDVGSLVTGAFLAGTQIWFGFYVFLFLAMSLVIYALFNWRSVSRQLDPRRSAKIALTFLAPCAPLLALYFYYEAEHRPAPVYVEYNEQIRAMTSLKLHHFWNVLENVWLHATSGNVYDASDVSATSRLRKSAFPGLLFVAFVLVGLPKTWRTGRWLLGLALVFFALSFGSNSFAYALFEELPLSQYLRIPLRFHLFTLLAASVVFAMGLETALTKLPASIGSKARLAILTIVGVLVLLETTPIPLRGYSVGPLLKPSDAYVRFFEERGLPRSVVFDLPSNLKQVIPEKGDDAGLVTSFSRELLYMNWQPHHGQILAGGVSGYQPPARNRLDEAASFLPGPGAIDALRRFGIRYLVFHKNMILLPGDDVLEGLKRSPELKLRYEDERLAILEY